MTQMERQVTSNLLRHAAGTALFCRSCNQCLNWPTTVIVDLFRRGHIPLAVGSITICSTCFDAREAHVRAICAEANLQMEVTRKGQPLAIVQEES